MQRKELREEQDVKRFFNSLPHQYYEENNLHAFLIEQIKDFSECVLQTQKFLCVFMCYFIIGGSAGGTDAGAGGAGDRYPAARRHGDGGGHR